MIYSLDISLVTLPIASDTATPVTTFAIASSAVSDCKEPFAAVVPAPDAEVDDFSGHDENVVAEQLEKAPIGSNAWQGWNMCYRKSVPEATNDSRYARNMRKKTTRMGNVVAQLPWVGSKKTPEQVKAASDRNVARRKVVASS